MRRCAGSPIDFDEHVLELGVVAAMDNETFIEYLTRMDETEAQTKARVEALVQQHRDWHTARPHYIAACFINWRTT